MSAAYSRIPPTIAPRRLAANAVVDVLTDLKRCVKTRFAKNTGANARDVAARKRGTTASESRELCGTAHATISEASSRR